MLKITLALLFVGYIVAQTGDIQIMPNDSVLFASTQYEVSYYTFNNMPINSTIIINFNATYIGIPNGALNITSVPSSSVSLPSATANCLNSICTIRLNRTISAKTNIKFLLSNLTNPYFIQRQSINTVIIFNSTYTENLNWIILQQKYTPMLIKMNSYSQSNYGVGNTNITYNFNFSVSMIPPQIQFSVTIPPQVSVDTIKPVMIFYGSPIFLQFVFVNSMLIFKISVTSTNSTDPSGFISLSLSGLTNPKSIGNSSSFIIQMLIPNFPGTNSQCTNCIFAQITDNVLAKSTVAGNIEIVTYLPSNSLINKPNNITISTKLFASIPIGGVYEIILPPSIKPSLPVYCSSGYGFTVINSNPSCSYNQISNSISTNNFYFSGVGIVVITISIINPADTEAAYFNFITFDANSNKIGLSSNSYPFIADPNPLTFTATKSSNQIETNFRLILNITLQTELKPTDFINIILPPANYNTSSIICKSQGINLNCISLIDPTTLKLNIKINPPCTNCIIGTILLLTVDGLNNPSYISSSTQQIIVLTGRNSAIIEKNKITINLSPSILSISNYNRSGLGSKQLGGSYSLSFTYNVTTYIKNNGGNLIINFQQLQSYINPTYNQLGVAIYPSSISIKDSQGNTYPNEVQYYTDNLPNSLKRIKIYICGTNACSNNIIVTGVRKGFVSINGLNQNIQITTQFDDLVNDNTFSIAQFKGDKLVKPLNLNLTNRVTNQNSDYMITFISNQMPFQSTTNFSFSSLHKIKGGCFVTVKSTKFTPIFNCQVINQSSLTFSYDGEITKMMVDIVEYTLTVTNISNPVSIIPIQYNLVTMFNNVINQQFTLVYAIENALPLTLYYTKTNNTLGQSAVFNILIATIYPSFDEIKINIPAGLMAVTTSSSYKFSMINNIYQISQVYSLNNNSININIVNPTSTGITSNIALKIFKSGYLAATGQIAINAVIPVLLGLSASVSSRIVGDTTSLTLNFNRIHEYATQSQYNINILPNLFDLSSASYNNAPAVFPIVVPVGVNTIVITGLKNLLYIPNVPPNDSITVWTTDNFGHRVALSFFNSKDLSPNTPTSSNSFSFIRTNTAIGGAGSLIINYTPKFSTYIGLMTINLPNNQTIMKTPSCQMLISNVKNNCNIIFNNQSTITLSFANQTLTTLTNILNIEPNANNISIFMYTSQNQLIQSVRDSVTPAIQYNNLGITGDISSSFISTNAQLNFNIQTFNTIEKNYKILIKIPNNIFMRIPSNIYPNCSYTMGGVTYSNNCIYTINDKFQVTAVNFTYLGQATIGINSVIIVQLYFTNYWAVVPFQSDLLTVSVLNTADFIVNHGTISMINLHNGLDRLKNSLIKDFTFSQSSTLPNTDNLVSLSFSTNVTLAVGSNMLVTIPKSGYIFKSVNNSTNSYTFINSTQNSQYYYITLTPKCTQPTPVCRIPNSVLTISLNLQNHLYVKLQQNLFSIQLIYNSNIITSASSFTLPMYSSQGFLNPSINRSNRNAYQITNATVAFTIPTQAINAINNIRVIISPLIITNSVSSIPLVTSPSKIILSSSLLSYEVNSTNHLKVNVSKFTTQTTTLIISGTNNLLVSSNNPQQYYLTIQDDNYIYFNGIVKALDNLIPYGSGITVQRIIATVGQITPIYLIGKFPINIPPMSLTYKNINYLINNQTFNVSLGTLKNSNNITDTTSLPIVIKNNDFISFSNNLSISPSLTSRNLQQFISFTIPAVANVSSNINLVTRLNSINLTYFSIITPYFITNVTNCCIDLSCTQTNILSCKLIFNQTTLKNIIQLILKTQQVLSNITIQANTLDYQQAIKDQSVTINTGLPTSTILTTVSINIIPLIISTGLTLKNQKVNQFNNYQLQIQAFNKSGFLRIVIPKFIGNQLNSPGLTNSSYQALFNNTIAQSSLINSQNNYSIVLPITNKANLMLQFFSLINPINNQPFSFTIQQAIDSQFNNIYGKTTVTKTMTQFQNIIIKSATRSVTKFSQPTTITLEITNPMLNENIIIVFPSSQVVLGPTCSVKVNSANIIACQVLNSTALTMNSLSGTQTYAISGFINNNVFNIKAIYDKITAVIGNPFISATTNQNSTTYITPRLTYGIINVNSITYNNNNMLSSNTIIYDITIQHLDIDGFVIQYDSASYLLNNQIECLINQQKTNYTLLSNNKILISYLNINKKNLTITIKNIMNFIKPAPWTIQSVRNVIVNVITTYSQVDFYHAELNLINKFNQYPLKLRMLNNTFALGQNPISIYFILDSKLIATVPISKLKLDFKIGQNACQMLKLELNQTFIIKCTLNQTKDYSVLVQMYHQDYSKDFISSYQNKLTMYPLANNNCTNSLCFSCSSNNGKQYCFKCKSGFASEGLCLSSCSSYQFSSAGSCQPCSPNCGSCFGPYQSQCLSCYNSSMVLNSGLCQANCPISSYNYKQYCVINEECQSVEGCRTCSSSNFCYECLPDFNGEPICTYKNPMPETIMIYILLPFLIVGIIFMISSIVKCLDFESFLSQAIFSLSFIQFFSWLFSIPIMNNLISIVLLASFFVIRIFISIGSYEFFYKRNIGELHQKLIEDQSQKQIQKTSSKKQQAQNASQETWKTNLVKFTAHFNGTDSYELLKSKIAQPILSLNHSLFTQIIFMINRWVVCMIMISILSLGQPGDRLFMPLIVVVVGTLISLCRLLSIDKIKSLINKCRT